MLLLRLLQVVACIAIATSRCVHPGSRHRDGSRHPEFKRRNVLLVVYDDLSARHNVYGWAQSATPVADAFAKEALVFDRAYCQQAVCSPSRASFLSGRRPDRTEQWTFSLPPPNAPGTGGWRNAPGASQWRSFPQWFKDNGYYTAGAGKLSHPGDPAYFDPLAWTEPRCAPNASNPGAVPWARQGAPGREGFPYYGQGHCPFNNLDPNLNPAPGWGCPVNITMQQHFCNNRTDPRQAVCFPDLLTLGTALEFLQKGAKGYRSGAQIPFWIGVGFTKPHYPQIYPAEIASLVPEVGLIELPSNPNFTTNGVPMEWMSEIDGGGMLQPASATVSRQARHDYYAAAAFSDSLLGELLQALGESGVATDTAVVLTADHGWGLGEHNHWSKYTNWETDARVPLMVRVPWKAQAMGKRTSAIVEHVDMYPSIAELVGVKVDKKVESVDGASWAGLLDDPTGVGHQKLAAYSQFPRCWPSRNPTRTKSDYDRMQRCLPNTGWDNHNMSFMGLSMRTKNYRYTEWHAWLGDELRPDWDDGSTMIELYNHTFDPPESTKISFEQFENVNIYEENKELAQQLGKQLREFFQQHSGHNGVADISELK